MLTNLRFCHRCRGNPTTIGKMLSISIPDKGGIHTFDHNSAFSKRELCFMLQLRNSETLFLSASIITSCKTSSFSSAESLNPKLENKASSTSLYDKDPSSLFMDPVTQSLLKSITQMNLDKIFQKTAVADNETTYKFMNTEQIQMEYRNAIKLAEMRLQMPPVVQIDTNPERVISQDPALTSFSDTKFVFTDITFGVPHSRRKVVVREIDGSLHYASLDIAKRMKQMYVPLDGRKIMTPKMFTDEYLTRCLNEHKYKFILDRLLIQFDPYESDYHRICGKVYEHLNDTKEYDQLRSTRHFGPMAFYYAWHRQIDDLLYEMIRKDYLQNGVELIILYYRLNNISENYQKELNYFNRLPTCKEKALKELFDNLNDKSSSKLHENVDEQSKSNIHQEIVTAIGKTAQDFAIDDICLPVIQNYISKYALKKVPLELAVQTFKELNTEKRQLFDGLNKAHGLETSL